MLLPNRHGNTSDYRYGFNGKEKDDEIKGEGVQYDYGFRIYDPRVSRFLSQDPLFRTYPWFTPYQFAGNSPIWAIDLDGLESKIVIHSSSGPPTVLQETENNRGAQWKATRQAYLKAFGTHENFTFGKEEYTKFGDFTPSTGTLTINATGNVAEITFQKGSFIDKLSHSLYSGAKAADTYFIHPDPLAEGSEKFQSTVKNVGLSVLAVPLAPLAVEYGVSTLTFEAFAAKATISGLAQATFNDGKVNLAGVVSDGLLFYQASSITGAGFELNIDFGNNFEFSSRSILTGDKSLKEFGIEASSSVLFGAKTSFFSKYLDSSSKFIGETVLEFSNQIGNYGVQKGVKDKVLDDEK
ncbi:MAG: hypothetical protein CVU08_08970 [Bacteroidetes bacterium HGW-Bacteroidetes-3]|nr:MAG: hypothetical protein CVU08_08970 [Bacteroidetes bacterium HGW-Bacteroidetes-3]